MLRVTKDVKYSKFFEDVAQRYIVLVKAQLQKDFKTGMGSVQMPSWIFIRLRQSENSSKSSTSQMFFQIVEATYLFNKCVQSWRKLLQLECISFYYAFRHIFLII
ncbi:hypothetical protein FGO68_gene204 [Halteria grandinella]|uniref:Uncharacterized protein n=1 Tax=Halteria grandinella TaxID=5974 RepID=A0A8J8NU68_HALGN|nr:hypothetical protein FGO68_gene204 [Halteria grandinella]